MKAIKRVVSTSFWEDDLILDYFTPEDRYFMLYLLTNPHSTQLGIYHLPIKKAVVELGYSKESVMSLLDRFENRYHIIKFNADTNEIAIKNYLRHSIVKGGKPVFDCLMKEADNVADKQLLVYIINNLLQYSNLNNTVISFINTIKDKYKLFNDKENDNENENDNERIVDESCQQEKKPEKASNVNMSMYEIVRSDFKVSDYLDYYIRLWLGYKDERHDTYRPSSIRTMIANFNSKAEEYSEFSVADIVVTSISKGYQGIYWDGIKKDAKDPKMFAVKPQKQETPEPIVEEEDDGEWYTPEECKQQYNEWLISEGRADEVI